MEYESRIPLELLSFSNSRDDRTLSTRLCEIFGASGDVSGKISLVDNDSLEVDGQVEQRTSEKKSPRLVRRLARARRQAVHAVFPFQELTLRCDGTFKRVLYELGYHSKEEQRDVAFPQSDEWRWTAVARTEGNRIEPWRVYLSARRIKRHDYSVTCPLVSTGRAREDEEGDRDEGEREREKSDDDDEDRESTDQASIDRWWKKTRALSYAKVAVAQLFPSLAPGSVFCGHLAARHFVGSASQKQQAFAELFSETSRVYATTLLRLPFLEPTREKDRLVVERRQALAGSSKARAVVKGQKQKRSPPSRIKWTRRLVDFRQAAPKVLAYAIAGEGTARDADSYFYALVACRAELGVDRDGTHVYLPLLPAPPGTPPHVKLHLKEADLLRPMEDDSSAILTLEPRKDPSVANYELQFWKLRDGKRFGALGDEIAVADFSTLNFWTRPGKMQPQRVSSLMSEIFPVAYRQSLDRVDLLRQVYAWRMTWRYATSRIYHCRGSDDRGRLTVTALTLRPWF